MDWNNKMYYKLFVNRPIAASVRSLYITRVIGLLRKNFIVLSWLSAACDELYRLLSCCIVELLVNKVYEKSVVICL